MFYFPTPAFCLLPISIADTPARRYSDTCNVLLLSRVITPKNPASFDLAGSSSLNGAGNGIRTRDFQLGKLTLYQLSYARRFKKVPSSKFQVPRVKKYFASSSLNCKSDLLTYFHLNYFQIRRPSPEVREGVRYKARPEAQAGSVYTIR